MSTQHLCVGDRVVVEASNGQRADGFEGRPLVVTGFAPYVVGHITHNYMGEGAPKPGIYLNPNQVSLATLDGLAKPGYSRHDTVRLTDSQQAKSRGLRPPELPPVFLRNLPDTTFWVGDVVRWGFISPPPDTEYVITGVDYFVATAHHDNPPGYSRLYALGGVLAPKHVDQRTVLEPANRLELVRRGPVWRHYHGHKPTFDSDYENIRFHILMGWFRVIDISTDVDSLKGKLWEGKIDGYFRGGGPKSPANTLSGIILRDRTVGQLYRNGLLENLWQLVDISAR